MMIPESAFTLLFKLLIADCVAAIKCFALLRQMVVCRYWSRDQVFRSSAANGCLQILVTRSRVSRALLRQMVAVTHLKKERKHQRVPRATRQWEKKNGETGTTCVLFRC